MSLEGRHIVFPDVCVVYTSVMNAVRPKSRFAGRTVLWLRVLTGRLSGFLAPLSLNLRRGCRVFGRQASTSEIDIGVVSQVRAAISSYSVQIVYDTKRHTVICLETIGLAIL